MDVVTTIALGYKNVEARISKNLENFDSVFIVVA